MTGLGTDRIGIFFAQLGGEAEKMPTPEFDILTARMVSAVVRDHTDSDSCSVPMHASPLVKANLFKACSELAAKR